MRKADMLWPNPESSRIQLEISLFSTLIWLTTGEFRLSPERYEVDLHSEISDFLSKFITLLCDSLAACNNSGKERFRKAN